MLVIGAGLSGIDAAYHLQTRCPTKSYAILEGRDTLGGTWDLFRYPGIRSDSDMYTLGFPFRPWTREGGIGDGASILAYLRDTAEHFGIDRHIHYRQRVESARWSSAESRWTLDVRDGGSGELARWTCNFLHLCVGYYDYAAGHTPELPGRERFGGRIVHPQAWTDDIEHAGKRVIVIGSGATAVTLVPALARTAAHVTMLQRSPTYILSMPTRDRLNDWTREHLPVKAGGAVRRWRSIVLGSAFYEYCRRFPRSAKRMLVKQVARKLTDPADIVHFTPRYDPWDQRLCLVPDADLFEALRAGRASVVTDHISTITETGIALASGQQLEADLIVTATGLQLKCLGGVAFEVDGRPVDPAKTLLYKGMMCSDVPNLAFSVGYTNASWTLKCDLTSQYVCRLVNYMDAHGYSKCCPRRADPSVEELPLINFSSGYVQRSIDQFPRQGSVRPWKLYQNYALDLLTLRYARVDDPAMELS